jgi:hypothetical protein
VTAIKIYDYGYGYGRFCSSNSNDEQSKKHPIQPVRPEVFIKCNKIQVHTIQNEFYAHQQRDQVSPGKKSIDPNEKQGSADKKYMI